ncbi:glycoside hydrolase superfamily [Cryomyces antarcticus]
MKKLLGKAKATLHDHHGHHEYPAAQGQDQQPMTDQPATIQPPTPLDVLRYRYHHATNLGSVFVLEQWLTPSMYTQGSQSAELAAVSGWIQQEGVDKARERFENHWKTYVSDSDLDWLANDAHCTSLRLPIGYFTLGPAYCQHTPFAAASPVYVNAWSAVRSLVSRARARGIGTLLDLHALPGGANGGDHSGTNSGKAQLWGNGQNLDLATRCLLFIAQEARSMDGVVGLQLCNEAEYDAIGMYAWYDSVIGQIAKIDNTLPLYISDAWNLGQAFSYTNGKNSLKHGAANPVVIDTHLYWAFTDADKAKTPQQIISEVSTKLSELDGKDGSVIDHGAAQVVVGEYSCVLTEDSWTKANGADKTQLVVGFGQAQSQRYQQRAGGSYFWTYKMDWMDGGEWGFAQQTKNNAIAPPASLTLPHPDIQRRITAATEQRDARRAAALAAHTNYWDSQHPGDYEHWRYEAGWGVGFDDAAAFLGMRASGALQGPGGDRIGMLDLWVRKRVVESGQAGRWLWEFEQGVRKGVAELYELAGV